jgi:sec-independent protein translocase protein TatB
MFGIGWSEFVVIGVVALIAIGPKELPGVLRAIGQWTGKIRRMANEFQGQFQEALREAEMADVRKELDEISAQATDIGSFDPVAEANKEVASALEDKPAAADTTAAAPVETVTAATLPEIDVPLPEPLPPVTNADFARPAAEPTAPVSHDSASELLPPSPKVPTGGNT